MNGDDDQAISVLDAAKRLLQDDVDRGISLKDIQKSQHGHSSPGGYDAQVGGWMPVGVKHYSTDYILVRRDMKGRLVNKAVRIKPIYDELKNGQISLL